MKVEIRRMKEEKVRWMNMVKKRKEEEKEKEKKLKERKDGKKSKENKTRKRKRDPRSRTVENIYAPNRIENLEGRNIGSASVDLSSTSPSTLRLPDGRSVLFPKVPGVLEHNGEGGREEGGKLAMALLSKLHICRIRRI